MAKCRSASPYRNASFGQFLRIGMPLMHLQNLMQSLGYGQRTFTRASKRVVFLVLEYIRLNLQLSRSRETSNKRSVALLDKCIEVQTFETRVNRLHVILTNIIQSAIFLMRQSYSALARRIFRFLCKCIPRKIVHPAIGISAPVNATIVNMAMIT